MTDLIDRLEALGRVAAPELDDARMDAIESRLLAATREPAQADRRWGLGLAVAAAIVVVVAGLVFATGGGGTARLEFADGVVLERPDAAPIPGESGDELPDGTIVMVGPGGSAVVGGDRFGPGRYVVVDGVLVVAPVRSTSTTVADRAAASRGTRPTAPPPSTGPPRVAPAPTVAPPATRPTEVVSDPSTTVARDRDVGPTTTVTGRDRPVATRPATSAPTTTPTDRTPPRTTVPERTTTVPERTTTSEARPTSTSVATTTTEPQRDGRDRP